MLRQISLAWGNIKNNGRTIGLLSLDNWHGLNPWRNKNELSTLVPKINYRASMPLLLAGHQILSVHVKNPKILSSISGTTIQNKTYSGHPDCQLCRFITMARRASSACTMQSRPFRFTRAIARNRVSTRANMITRALYRSRKIANFRGNRSQQFLVNCNRIRFSLINEQIFC